MSVEMLPGTPLDGPFDGREAFRQRVREALAGAAAQGWPELVLCDADFEDWPLGEAAVIESLNAWARQGRQLTMLALRYDLLQRQHARFVGWRQTWSHRIDCRRCADDDAPSFPSVLWSPGWALQRLDVPHCRGVAGRTPTRLVQLRELLDARWQRSTPGFAASTLGL